MAEQSLAPRLYREMVAILFILPAMAGPVWADERYTYADLVARLTDLERLATPVVPGEKTFASTSHDHGGTYDPQTDTYRRWNANGDGGGCIRREGDAQVMVDLEGPGKPRACRWAGDVEDRIVGAVRRVVQNARRVR